MSLLSSSFWSLFVTHSCVHTWGRGLGCWGPRTGRALDPFKKKQKNKRVGDSSWKVDDVCWKADGCIDKSLWLSVVSVPILTMPASSVAFWQMSLLVIRMKRGVSMAVTTCPKKMPHPSMIFRWALQTSLEERSVNLGIGNQFGNWFGIKLIGNQSGNQICRMAGFKN